MSIKLENNAIAHLAASLASTDTTAVLDPSESGNFPTLSAGEWHPMTIIAPGGAFEIVKVTDRSSNILTIERGFETTTARNFNAGDRVELRMTAAVVETLQSDLVDTRGELITLFEDGDAAVTAATTAAMAAQATSLRTDMDSKDAALAATMSALMDTKDTAQQAVVDTKDAALHSVITSEIATAKAAAVAQAEAYSDAALAAAVATLNSAIAEQADPVGSMKAWLTSTAPSGWVFCAGQALNRTTNAALFAVIGTTYGAGNGSTTFNVPDLRGRGAIGKDNMGGTAANRVTTAGSGLDGTTLGAAGGAQSHTLTVAQIPSHDHGGTTPSDGAHQHSINGGSNISGSAFPSVLATASGNGFGTIAGGGAHAHDISAQGGGSAHNNMPPSLVINYIIKT